MPVPDLNHFLVHLLAVAEFIQCTGNNVFPNRNVVFLGEKRGDVAQAQICPCNHLLRVAISVILKNRLNVGKQRRLQLLQRLSPRTTFSDSPSAYRKWDSIPYFMQPRTYCSHVHAASLADKFYAAVTVAFCHAGSQEPTLLLVEQGRHREEDLIHYVGQSVAVCHTKPPSL